MYCNGCLCLTCVLSVELFYVRQPGEITEGDEGCFSCDECRIYDGDYNKPSQQKDHCPKYREAAAHVEERKRAEAAKKKWQARNKKELLGLLVINGGKYKPRPKRF